MTDEDLIAAGYIDGPFGVWQKELYHPLMPLFKIGLISVATRESKPHRCSLLFADGHLTCNIRDSISATEARIVKAWEAITEAYVIRP